MTSVYQGLCLSRSMGRVGENPGNEVVLNLPNEQVKFFRVFKLQKNCNASQKLLGRLVKMILG